MRHVQGCNEEALRLIDQAALVYAERERPDLELLQGLRLLRERGPGRGRLPDEIEFFPADAPS